MKRRGFVLNSLVLVLLIPLLLLIATYEDISSQIITAQAERLQVERTFRGVGYLELDFQKALEIAGKRALITAVQYVASTSDFIDPAYGANNTIRDLLLYGSTSEIESTYASLMQDQTIYYWLRETEQKLRRQGFRLSPDISTIMNELEKSTTVAPLDSFRIVIISKIPGIKIEDFTGKIVYNGSIPRNGNITAIISIQDVEDPLFSAVSKGKYARAVKACPYSFPELSSPPLIVLEGNGSSTSKYLVGEYLIKGGEVIYGGEGDIIFNSNNIWYYDGSAYITNITMNNLPIKPPTVLNSGDRGVLSFAAPTTWYSTLQYRINVTIINNEDQAIGPVFINYIQFYVDGTSLNETKTPKGWEKVEISLPTGDHTIGWRQVGSSVIGYVDDVFVLQYPNIAINVSSTLDGMPAIVNVPARAYDIQPLLECIMGNRYFGIYNAPSFFERLEGSMVNHEEYVALAERVQDLLGISYYGTHYPIGLLSLMLPSDSPEYDTKLLDALHSFGVDLTQVEVDQVTSADYYFLQYYFARNTTIKNEKRGYRVWGISMGEYGAGDLRIYPFFLDPETAIAVFGNRADIACDLLEGYTCS